MPTKAQAEQRKKNLKPFKKGKRTSEEQARKAGIASGEARREKKLIKEEILNSMNCNDWDEMIRGVIERAKTNDKAFEILRDSIGQKPAQEVNVTSDAEEFEFSFKYSK